MTTENKQLDYIRNEFYNDPNLTKDQKEKLRLKLLKLLSLKEKETDGEYPGNDNIVEKEDKLKWNTKTN